MVGVHKSSFRCPFFLAMMAAPGLSPCWRDACWGAASSVCAGYGTLDETLEITTWQQLGFSQKPVGSLRRHACMLC